MGSIKESYNPKQPYIYIKSLLYVLITVHSWKPYLINDQQMGSLLPFLAKRHQKGKLPPMLGNLKQICTTLEHTEEWLSRRTRPKGLHNFQVLNFVPNSGTLQPKIILQGNSRETLIFLYLFDVYSNYFLQAIKRYIRRKHGPQLT